MLTTTLQLNLPAPLVVPTPSGTGRVPAVVRTVARTLTQDSIEVRWVLNDTDELTSNFQMFVDRSEGPAGPWLTISAPLVDVFLIVDRGVNQESRYRPIYYRVRIERISDPTDKYDGTPVTLGPQPDSILLAIRKRHRRHLQRKVGVWCAIFIRKTFGQRCDCWDNVLKQIRDPDCNHCFHTSFVGGYFSQLNTYVQVRPSPKIVQIPETSVHHDSTTDAWMVDSPIMRPGDLIVEPSNHRWRVMSIHTTEKRRAISRQIMKLTEIEGGDIEYELPVEEVEEPFDEYVGTYPPGTPGLWASSPDKPAGSGLL